MTEEIQLEEIQPEETIVGVRFRKEGKVYNFSPAGLSLKKGDLVVVDTENGPALGVITAPARPVPGEAAPAGLKAVLRLASPGDLQTRDELQELEKQARRYCAERIAERALPMKLIDVEGLFDRSKILFYFTAENRVDFRELVKDLVQKFRIRIELRQIGARHEARIVKGLGICGREVCCAGWLTNLDRVSVKMAKEQSMSLNPEKISGLCGRLMCCLAYEYDAYADMKKHMPKCGKIIQIESGRGRVIRQNVLQGEIFVQLEDGKEIVINVKDLK